MSNNKFKYKRVKPTRQEDYPGPGYVEVPLRPSRVQPLQQPVFFEQFTTTIKIPMAK